MTKRRTLADMKRKAKYAQLNPLVGVRFSKEQYEMLREVAKAKRWSMANVVSYAAEQVYGLPPGNINRR